MRFKILLMTLLVLLVACIALLKSNMGAQTTEITSLRERVYNLEFIVQREVIGKKRPVELKPTRKSAPKVGPEPVQTKVPSFDELVEGLPTLAELLGEPPQFECAATPQNHQPLVFHWECVSRPSAYERVQNPLADYVAEQRLRQQHQQAQWDQTEMMNSLTSIQSDLSQIRQLQQEEQLRQAFRR